MAKAIKITFRLIVYIFALIGFVLVGGYFAVRWNLTKVTGAIDNNSSSYQQLVDNIKKQDSTSKKQSLADQEKEQQQTLCKIKIIGRYSPTNAKSILDKYTETYSRTLAEKMIFAVEVRLKNDPGYTTSISSCQNEDVYQNLTITGLKRDLAAQKSTDSIFPWMNTEQWQTIKQAITKDKDSITEASNKAGISPRMVTSACIVEQLRLYFTQRELYENIFKPLQILGNSNKMAWGVMSIKENTAIDIENHLKDQSSPYYLGPDYEHMLDFASPDPTQERYQRLTTQGDYYYSYLYGALYMKQFATQWQKAGYNIADRPEILSTLFNLGFDHSQPKANPEVGGSTIDINGTGYTFGSLAYEFYYSGELEDIFPLTDDSSNNSTNTTTSSQQQI